MGFSDILPGMKVPELGARGGWCASTVSSTTRCHPKPGISTQCCRGGPRTDSCSSSESPRRPPRSNGEVK